MKTMAAILVETGQPLEIVELEIPALKPGQVLVEIYYSGICHAQLMEARGYKGEDRLLPHCMGHEGVGIVREIGVGVTKVAPEQKVILSWIRGLGAEVSESLYQWKGRTVNAGPITTFSRYAVISENRLTPLPAGTPVKEAALLGCAVPTGAGAVLHTGKPLPGQSVAVFGVGGVGLFAVAAARALGAAPIIAVDINDKKLEAAFDMGATYTIHGDREVVMETLATYCPGGVDVAVEATGLTAVMLQAVESVRPQGGRAVIIGNARHGEMLTIDPRQLNQGKQILGTWGGETRPEEDYPLYCRMLQYGRLDFSPLLDGVYPLTAVNTAMDDLEAGCVIRPLLDMSDD
ncbi:MAG TPA: zinc-binding dehydrogenase [Patescibacteria group bacterium]|nr:zinc-binding dehydrogenase [Patescibacteria group bacterium]